MERHSFRIVWGITRNSAENFRTRKLGEITVFFTLVYAAKRVYLLRIILPVDSFITMLLSAY